MLTVMLLTACSDSDLKKADTISAKQAQVPVETSRGVEMIYSDSAVVKGKMTAPLLLNYKTDKPYMEMPKGVHMVFYDKDMKVMNTVVSEYAIRKDYEKLVILKKNVVVTTNDGSTFKSEELIWDETKKIFYSNLLVHVVSNGSAIDGTSFSAPQDFKTYHIVQSAGDIATKGLGLQP